ncbi:MAG: 3-deoxy-7-phosphoheptulonate synthase [Candidatus Brocadiia bacterium]
MIIVMEQNADEDKIHHAIDRVEEKGLEAILLRGEKRNVIAAIGDKREIPEDYWLATPGVERIVPILSRYKLASQEISDHATRVHIDGQVVGGNRIAVIAGPCAVESEEQMMQAARSVKAAGAVALRGGAYKPRTSPYSFQGLQGKGLEILSSVREETGLPVVTEVLAPRDVEEVAECADVLQIGARNMQNYVLLEEVGKTDKPVLLKRGISATVDELLLAAEYVLKNGNAEVILCLRGIRTFEQQTRYTLSIGALAYLKQATHLPVIVDPSHSAGQRSLVAALARAGIAAGADGLLVETHPNPEQALVDGGQSLTLDGFGKLMCELRGVAEALGRSL